MILNMQDGAAVTGLAIAAASLVAVNKTGNAVYDPIGSIIVGHLLGMVYDSSVSSIFMRNFSKMPCFCHEAPTYFYTYRLELISSTSTFLLNFVKLFLGVWHDCST